jgi:hypothetical protein
MEDFLDYVPLDHDHLEVYSMQLVSIILEVGSEITSLFDLIVFAPHLEPYDLHKPEFDETREKLLEKEKSRRKQNRSLTFKDYTDFLNESKSLNTQPMQIFGLNAYTLPFTVPCKKVHPEWWDAYNLLKHDKYNNLKKATLKNALKSLAALALLKYLYIENEPTGEPLESNLFGYLYDIENRRNQLTEI